MAMALLPPGVWACNIMLNKISACHPDQLLYNFLSKKPTFLLYAYEKQWSIGIFSGRNLTEASVA